MGAFLKKPIGPLPVWMWFAIFVLAVVLFLKLRNRSGDGRSGGTEVNPSIIQGGAPMYSVGMPDVFVNVQAPAASGTTTGGTATGGTTTGGTTTGGTTGGTTTNNTPTPAPRVTSITYSIKSGDTLYAIAKKYGISISKLYAANKSVIEAVAKQHGFKSSDSGHWIFPGTKLVVPK